MASNDILRVSHVRVVDLFGKYSHEVPLRTTDRVTIIHGPNGVGKTVLLRLVVATLTGNFPELLKVPFHAFEVTLSDGSTLGFRKPESSKKKKDEDDLVGMSYLKRDGKSEHQFELKASQVDTRRLVSILQREMPWLTQIAEDRYLDQRFGEEFTSAELFVRFSDYFSAKLRKRALFSEPEWMADIRDRASVHLIEAQRLLRFPPQTSRHWEFRRPPSASDVYVATVKSYARDLQARISETLTTYAKQSQSLDQSFPQRLLKSTVRPLTVEDLKKRMQELENKRQQLKKIGLIDEDSTYPFDVKALEELDETRRTVMTLYVEDTGRKLGVLDDLSRRVVILLENINRKFKDKSVLLDREKGLVARAKDNNDLELDALSSGEQHELVLLYDLLFRVKPNTLVLIDEPELSLHVTWQKSFLPDLLEAVAATGFDVILATHSPFIVGERHDLMVPLSIDEDDQKNERVP